MARATETSREYRRLEDHPDPATAGPANLLRDGIVPGRAAAGRQRPASARPTL